MKTIAAFALSAALLTVGCAHKQAAAKSESQAVTTPAPAPAPAPAQSGPPN